MSEIRQTEGWGHCMRCGKDVAITSYGRPTLCHLQSASCVPLAGVTDHLLPRAYQIAFAPPTNRPFLARIYPLGFDMTWASDRGDPLMATPTPNHNYDVQIPERELRGRPLPEPAYDHWTRTEPLRGEDPEAFSETRDEFRARIGVPPRKPKLSARLLRQMALRARKSALR